jgi:hypothetical protein
MTSAGHGVWADFTRRLPLRRVLARTRKGARQHPIIVAAVVLAVGGGAAAMAIALNSSSGVLAAAACPGATSYAYEVPGAPGQGWGWTFLKHPLKIGDSVQAARGGVVTAIAALPDDCRTIAANGPIGGAPIGIISGRLILRPVDTSGPAR